MTLNLPVTEPAAAHHMGQAVQAAIATDATRALVDFRQEHGDPAGWCAAECDAWLERSDAVLAATGVKR